MILSQQLLTMCQCLVVPRWFRSYYYTINWDKIQNELEYMSYTGYETHIVLLRRSQSDHTRPYRLERQLTLSGFILVFITIMVASFIKP